MRTAGHESSVLSNAVAGKYRHLTNVQSQAENSLHPSSNTIENQIGQQTAFFDEQSGDPSQLILASQPNSNEQHLQSGSMNDKLLEQSEKVTSYRSPKSKLSKVLHIPESLIELNSSKLQ